jgi:hypothetical protein
VIRSAALLLALAAVAAPGAAEACTFSWKRGFSPEEIKRRPDVREVKGTWRMSALEGERFTDDEGQEWVRGGRFTGRIETTRGTRWSTWHRPPDMTTTCYIGSYFKPEADAKGTFWIARRKVGGRFEILLWEGEYVIPGTPMVAP